MVVSELCRNDKNKNGSRHKGAHLGKKQKSIIYYNEREWRYSPKIDEYRILSASIEENKQEKIKLNQALKKEKLLMFSPEDIKFIIIKNKKDIDDLTNVIRKMKITPGQRNELLTKIRTFEEIKEDY